MAKLSIQGYRSSRAWIKANVNIVNYLQKYPEFKDSNYFKLWEHPFVFKEVMKRPSPDIVDIGIGKGVLASVFKKHNRKVVGVDSYEGQWQHLDGIRNQYGIECVHGNACDLSMFQDEQFDIAISVSVIEHVPTNMIFNFENGIQVWKTAEMVQNEVSDKLKMLAEAVRIIKIGGVAILTSDIYLDYPSEMNISWNQLLGIHGLDRSDLGHDGSDLYIVDVPHHKGRAISVGIIIEKLAEDAHLEILNRIKDR